MRLFCYRLPLPRSQAGCLLSEFKGTFTVSRLAFSMICHIPFDRCMFFPNLLFKKDIFTCDFFAHCAILHSACNGNLHIILDKFQLLPSSSPASKLLYSISVVITLSDITCSQTLTLLLFVPICIGTRGLTDIYIGIYRYIYTYFLFRVQACGAFFLPLQNF